MLVNLTNLVSVRASPWGSEITKYWTATVSRPIVRNVLRISSNYRVPVTVAVRNCSCHKVGLECGRIPKY